MSSENVELVKRLQPSCVDLVERLSSADTAEAFLGADVDAETFAEDLEVEWIAAHSAEGLHYRGGSGMLEGWRDWLTPWASYRIESREFIDAGDQVVVFVHIRARTSRDDVIVEHSPAAIWTIENGRVVRIRFFLERDEALKAVGLRV
jgi:ketosteroid isomerase-like protein